MSIIGAYLPGYGPGVENQEDRHHSSLQGLDKVQRHGLYVEQLKAKCGVNRSSLIILLSKNAKRIEVPAWKRHSC